MDTSRWHEIRDFLAGEVVRQLLPHLGEDFEVLAPPTRAFNCVAHALGRQDEWINPVTGPPEDPFREMDRRYGEHGFTRLPTLDLALVPGVQKVAVYALRNAGGGVEEITHAALQEADGTWSSKLGQGPLIRHGTVEALAGPAYGEPVTVYVRPSPTP